MVPFNTPVSATAWSNQRTEGDGAFQNFTPAMREKPPALKLLVSPR